MLGICSGLYQLRYSARTSPQNLDFLTPCPPYDVIVTIKDALPCPLWADPLPQTWDILSGWPLWIFVHVHKLTPIPKRSRECLNATGWYSHESTK